MQEAGFNLREWHSNCEALAGSDNTCSNTKSETSVLGLNWDFKSDQLSVPMFETDSKPITKRTIVSFTARVFDPIGWFLGVVVRAKMFIQTLWLEGYGWDDPILGEKLSEWMSIQNDILEVLKLKISRKFKTSSETDLHIFVDASSKAMGVVAYFMSSAGLQFVLAKSRLVPTKPPTLPQLELTAIELGVRVSKFIKETFKHSIQISNVYIWSDSQIALSWIRDSSKCKQYVKNRVTTIQNLKENTKFMFVPGELNSADVLTRGMSAKQFANSTGWHEGPSWLYQSWPSQTLPIIQSGDQIDQIALSCTSNDTIAKNSEIFFPSNDHFKNLRQSSLDIRESHHIV